MVSKMKKKYSVGEGSQFMSRGTALKKLQVPLKTFRKLCILKGIYPREPRNRKRAQKGNTAIKTLYHKKDILFLLQEPIVWKLRDYKVFSRKVGRAKALKDFRKMRRYLDNHPTLKLDHIVKERYPTFIDALRDLDDCLTLCFLFSTFPSMPHIPRDQFDLCRRLTVEFLHAVIAAKALRKVFVSIKGYYYQAELKGQTITWIVPHHFSFEPQAKTEVDFHIMSTFVEFYTILLGFVNFRLYHSLNIYYPPKLSNLGSDDNTEKDLIDEEGFVAERIAALNIPLITMSNHEEEEVEIDQFPSTGSTEDFEEANKETVKMIKLKSLFKGLKIFLNREVPREGLVFIIRSFGGEVSWDKTVFVGSTFDENDETITHQIVDRPMLDKQYMSRYYMQPQWIFDSVNARELLPVQKYFIGEVLPPHLSPFVDKSRGDYMPPEEKALEDPSIIINKAEESEEEIEEAEEADAKIEQAEEIEEDDEIEQDEEDEQDEEIEPGSEDEDQESDEEAVQKPKKNELSVTPGEVYKEPAWEQTRIERQEYRLRERMVKNKHRRLYRKMMESKKEKAKEIWLLRKKRRLHDEESRKNRKSKKIK